MRCWKPEFIVLLGLFPYYSVSAVEATIPPPSPRCWKTAWKLFQHVQQDQHNSDTQAICSVMPEEQRKALALEIASAILAMIKDQLMNELHKLTMHQLEKPRLRDTTCDCLEAKKM
jgi:hypothetical protein